MGGLVLCLCKKVGANPYFLTSQVNITSVLSSKTTCVQNPFSLQLTLSLLIETLMKKTDKLSSIRVNRKGKCL